MSLTRYEPWRLADQLHNEINRVFGGWDGNLQAGDHSEVVTADWIPSVDIKEEEERFVVHADIPGVDPKDIEITMEDNVLTLRGQRFAEKRDADSGFRRVERVSGQFFRRFALPDTADPDNISAHGKHGVLEIVIPKQERVKPRRIEVKAT